MTEELWFPRESSDEVHILHTKKSDCPYVSLNALCNIRAHRISRQPVKWGISMWDGNRHERARKTSRKSKCWSSDYDDWKEEIVVRKRLSTGEPGSALAVTNRNCSLRSRSTARREKIMHPRKQIVRLLGMTIKILWARSTATKI